MVFPFVRPNLARTAFICCVVANAAHCGIAPFGTISKLSKLEESNLPAGVAITAAWSEIVDDVIHRRSERSGGEPQTRVPFRHHDIRAIQDTCDGGFEEGKDGGFVNRPLGENFFLKHVTRERFR